MSHLVRRWAAALGFVVVGRAHWAEAEVQSQLHRRNEGPGPVGARLVNKTGQIIHDAM